jgi:hypothetical protein
MKLIKLFVLVIFIILAFLITGCSSTAPVKRNFPSVPEELLVSCPELKEVPETVKLSEVISVVVDNYGQYHQCAIKSEGWIEWYKSQKEIFESVK